MPTTGPSFAQRALADRARRRTRARRLLVAAVALLAALAWGMANPTDSLAVHDLLDHPITYGLLAWLLVAAGIAGQVDHPQHRVVAACLLGGVGITCFALGGLVISAGVSREHSVTTLGAPPPSGLEAVVDANGDDTNPVTRVVVQDRAWSLGAHRHEVACVHSKDPAGQVDTVTWSGPAELAVRVRGGDVRTVRLADDGAAAAALRVGILCTR